MLSRLWQVDAAAEAQLTVRRINISGARSKSGDVASIKLPCVCRAEVTVITWEGLCCSLSPAASLLSAGWFLRGIKKWEMVPQRKSASECIVGQMCRSRCISEGSSLTSLNTDATSLSATNKLTPSRAFLAPFCASASR